MSVPGKKGGIRARYGPGLFLLSGLFMVWSLPGSATGIVPFPDFRLGVKYAGFTRNHAGYSQNHAGLMEKTGNPGPVSARIGAARK
jgi:hypothetical protein